MSGLTPVAVKSAPVLHQLRNLFRLLRNLPSPEQRQKNLVEARGLIRQRLRESDNQRALDYQKELASKIAFLRVITPKPIAGHASKGTFVLRDGKLIEASGETRGSRWDGITEAGNCMQ